MESAPVAATAARLAALDEYAGFAVRPEAGTGWVALATAEADGSLDRWLARLVTEHGGRNVAGSTLGAALASAVLGPTVGALLIDRRCPDPALPNLTARPDDTGEFEARGVRTAALAVLIGDEAATHPDSVALPDEDALDEWWASRAAATLSALFEAVCTRAPFGRRNLWGLAADDVSATALWLAQLAGLDQQAAWSRAQRLLDALARHAPVRFPRAQPFPAGGRLHQVRGTCCLYYRSSAAIRCDTCPLRDDASRRERLLAYP
jgi:hypothetical protein